VTRRRVLPLTPAWNWEGLTPGTAGWRGAWEDLGDWVQWYTATHELWQSMPLCWYRHSRLVEELRALRFHHEAVFAARLPIVDPENVPPTLRPSARAYSEWMTARREWERMVLGLDPRNHGGCSGPAHENLSAATARGRADRLRGMAEGLAAMLDTTVPRHGGMRS
jgi:hypothetical protein